MTASPDILVSTAIEMRPLLYKKLKRIVGDEDIEDAIQETHELVLNMSARRQLGVENPRRYITAVALLVARKLRLRKRVDPLAQHQYEVSSAERQKTPEEEVGFFQEFDRVAHAVEGLHPRWRQVFTLRYAYDFSYKQIAEKLGLRPHAVERLLHESRIAVQGRVPRGERDASVSASTLYDVSKQVVVPDNKIITDVAPRIVVASAALAERLKCEPQSVYDLAPRQFELLIGELLEDLGYRVEVTRATRDGGKDLLAYLETEIGTLLCLVQAKKYRRERKVGLELVKGLYATLTDEQASHAMLITTSSFTKDALEFQHRHQYQLALKDYDDLQRWIRQYRRR
jgi:RNA polymerase sigma factor (sigma-70 family)